MMHSSMNHFLFFSLVLFINPKYMRPLQLASSSKLFDLRTLPHSYLTFLGDSHLRSGEIILTKEGRRTDAGRSAGVVLYSNPILFVDPRSKKVPSFNTTFAFSMGNLDEDGEAFGDGLTFLISPNLDLLGSPGYLGLVDSTDLTKNKFIAIEFDTRRDSRFHDPDDNHVGLDINSLFSVKLATSSSLGVNLKNGYLIISWIDYKSNDKRLEVFLSDSRLKPKKPLLKVDIDLSDHIKEKMFVGFSAATEGSMQLSRIQQWEFIVESSPPPPPSPPDSGQTLPNHSESGHKHGHPSKFPIGLTVGFCCIPFLVLFSGFCWKKLVAMVQKLEGTNNVETPAIKSSRGIPCQDIQCSVLVDEVTKCLNIEKVLGNGVELDHVKTVIFHIPLCSRLPAAKLSTLPPCKSLPLRTNDITLV